METDVYDAIVAASESINEHYRAIEAMPSADCRNCGSSSHMAVHTGVCLGCEMAAHTLFDLLAGGHFGGPS